jgi:3-oxoacyl-[acyl-carrier protein] reductase
MKLPGIDGRVALVTGANHGIGAATARILARNGAAVLVTYFRTARHGEGGEVADEIRAGGGRAVAVEADLADDSTPSSLFDAAEAAFGPVDIVVNNATGSLNDTFKPISTGRFERPLQPVSAATFDHQFAVDARGGALMIAEFARRLVARDGEWGRIISLTSGGPLGFPEEASYGAAKAALVNYTMTAALELAQYGVTANAVYPPVTDTGWVTDAVREFVARSPEHFHVATAEQVAEVIAWVASDAAHLLTANVVQLR